MDNDPTHSQSDTNDSLDTSKNIDLQLKYNKDTDAEDIWSQIIKLNLPRILSELHKRKLNTKGTLPELRSRLNRYIKGDYTETDFDNTISPIITDEKIKMSERIPFCKPNKFSGAIHENVDSFIHKYNKASTINGWSDEQKSSFLSIYLLDTASTFLDNFEKINPKPTWEQTEKALRLEFEHTSQTHMLRTMLEKRKQLPDESIASYINDAENLCKRIDSNMLESELVYTILKGLKPEIARYIGMLENNNLQDLKKNIRKYESIEFMINGKSTQSPDDIRNQITREHINAIDENKTQKQIQQLSSQISNLENIIKNMNSNRNYNYNRPKYPNNQQSQINQSNQKQGNYLNRYNQYPNNNNFNRSNQQPMYKNFENKIPCEHCHRYGHTSSECKWKLICDICQKRYHTSDTCYSKDQNTIQKNA